MGNKHSKFFKYAILGILVLITLGAYFKIFHAEFVYDDLGFIVNNKDIQSFSPISKFLLSPDIFTGSKYTDEGVGSWAKNWRPVASFAFASEYAWFGLNPHGFHLVSIILHLIAIILVYFLIYKLTKRPGIAIIAASLWALHPTLTETVSWVSNQSSSFFLIFFLAAILSLLRSASGTKSFFWLSLSYLFFSLSLLSKETALAGIFIIPLIYFGYPESEKLNFKNVSKIAPFFLLAALYFVARYKIIGALGDHALRGSFWHNLLLAPTVFSKYVGLAFWPKNLLLNYANYSLPRGFWDIRVITGILLFGFAGFLLWRSFKKPWFNIGLGVSWFFFFLLPVMQIIPFQDVIGERFLYAPLVGFFLSLVLAFDYLFTLIKSRLNFNLAPIGKVAAILVILGFAFLTLNRNNDWVNSENLWSSVLKIDPKNERALGNLGAFYIHEKEAIKGIEVSKKLLEINPRSIGGHMNLGAAFAIAGDLKSAEAEFLYLTNKLPDYKPALRDLAVVYMNSGRYQEAFAIMQKLNARYKDDDDIKQIFAQLKEILRHGDSVFPGSINGYKLGVDSDHPYIQATLQGPAVSGNVVNSGIMGNVVLKNGQPFEISLEIFKTNDTSNPFISVRTHSDGAFQIPLRPGSYFLKPLYTDGSIATFQEKYQFSIGTGQWLQIKIESK